MTAYDAVFLYVLLILSVIYAAPPSVATNKDASSVEGPVTVNGSVRSQAREEEDDEYQLKILDSLFLNYDSRLRAKPPGGGPTVVTCDCYVRGISSIDEIAMEYTVDLLIRERWQDQRLAYNNTLPNATAENMRTFPFIKAAKKTLDKLWVPDLFFANEKKAYFHEVTVPNIMLRIYPNGDILYSTRFSLVLSCDMNLVNYPFDTQHCRMQLGSFSYIDKALIFQWKDVVQPITVNRELLLPKFNLTMVRTVECRNEHYTGNFSCLRAEFIFNRELGYHLVQAYLPTTLLVMASWISFWLDVEASPARVALGVTTLLTTTAQATNIKHTLPPVSYTKAIDIWLGMCTTFVFCALVEFALVNYIARKDRLANRAKEKQEKKAQHLQQAMNNFALGAPAKAHHGPVVDVDLHEGPWERQARLPLPPTCRDCDEPLLITSNNHHHGSPLLLNTLSGPVSSMRTCCGLCTVGDGRKFRARATFLDRLSRWVFPFAFTVFVVVYGLLYRTWTVAEQKT